MKRTIAIALTLTAAFALNTFAQDLPMLRSKDALRTYALEQSANVAASINASLPVGNNSYGYVPVEEATASSISNTIRGMNLSVDVANPNDSLFVWAGAYNADGDPLFTGYHQFSLVNGKGSYALPPDYGDVTLTLFDNIPIKVNADAQSAIIDILGPDGKTQMEYSLDVRNGKVYFPRQLAGTNAMLAVYISGSKGVGPGWLYWNVNNGSQVNPEHFNVTLKPTIQGVVSVTDLANVWLSIPTTNGIGNNLTVEYKSTGKSWVGASFYTTEGKWFTGAWVRKAGTSDWVPYTATIGEKAVFINIPIQQGIYYIVPTWNPGDLTEPADPWYPPYDGGGKG